MEEKEIYYQLVNKIKKNGVREDKRHGYYFHLKLFDGYVLTLDSWSSAIYVSLNGKQKYHLGIDFGGFNCDIFWTKFWSAHC